MKQLQLLPKPQKEHGGSLNDLKRKSKKTLHSKKVIHLVLKCHKNISLRNNKDFVCKTINRQALLSGVKIYSLSIQHDHIHHAICFADRIQYNQFIRAITGLLARKYGRGLWRYRPYTRIVEWGRDYQNLKAYIKQNELEAMGVTPYKIRQIY